MSSAAPHGAPLRGAARQLICAALVASAPFVGCASPPPRAIAVAADRVQAFEACPRPEGRRDAGFRALLDARLADLGGDVLALADDLRERACVVEVFVSPPIGNLRELHVTYRDGLDDAWVVDILYPDRDHEVEGKLPHIGGVMKKRAPNDNPR